MAPGLKRWIGVVAVCAGGLVLLLVGWANAVIDDANRSYAEAGGREYYESLVAESHVAEAIRNIRLVDRLSRHTDADTVVVLAGAPSLAPPDSVRETVAAELARLRDRGSGGDVLVATAPARWLLPDTTRRRISNTHDAAYMTWQGERPVCAAVLLPYAGWQTRDWYATRLRPGTMLGPCWWVAAYGAPSDAVATWLARGGGRFAQRYLGEPRISWRISRSTLFGSASYSGLTLEEEACVDGHLEACEAAVLEPLAGSGQSARTLVPDDPLLYASRGSRTYARFAGAGEMLLADLEAAVGPEAFRRFWTSDQDIRTAMGQALGRPAGGWIHDWARDRLTVPPTRAGIPPGDWLLTLLALGLLTGLAVILARRKRA